MPPAEPGTDGLQNEIPEYVIETMARALYPKLRDFYACPSGQAAFEEWKRNQGLKEGNQ